MTRIKLCGLTRPCDIQAANELLPDFIGFVFAERSRRYVTPPQAAALKGQLDPKIKAVGVFVNEDPAVIAGLLADRIIDMAQLHGSETEDDIRRLRALTAEPIIKAFRIDTLRDVRAAEDSSADYVLLDSGTGGTGTEFDWELIRTVRRPYFLAGGLGTGNIAEAVRTLKPFAVDVSSGIETGGLKDRGKMKEFVHIVRKVDTL